jgi:hypothetical protein
MPETGALPDPWWSTPNIHLCTLRDFTELCRLLDLRIDACAALSGGRPARSIDPERPLENWRSETALFLLSRRRSDAAGVPPVDLLGEALPIGEPERALARPRRRRKSS